MKLLFVLGVLVVMGEMTLRAQGDVTAQGTGEDGQRAMLEAADRCLEREQYAEAFRMAEVVVGKLHPNDPAEIEMWALSHAIAGSALGGMGTALDGGKGTYGLQDFNNAIEAINQAFLGNQGVKDTLKTQSPDIYARLLEERGQALYYVTMSKHVSPKDRVKAWGMANQDWEEGLGVCQNPLEAARIHAAAAHAHEFLYQKDPKNFIPKSIGHAKEGMRLSEGREGGTVIWARSQCCYCEGVLLQAGEKGVHDWYDAAILACVEDLKKADAILQRETPNTSAPKQAEKFLAVVSDCQRKQSHPGQSGGSGSGSGSSDNFAKGYQIGRSIMKFLSDNDLNWGPGWTAGP